MHLLVIAAAEVHRSAVEAPIGIGLQCDNDLVTRDLYLHLLEIFTIDHGFIVVANDGIGARPGLGCRVEAAEHYGATEAS